VRLQPVLMNNHNNLLGRIPGVDGLKTGFTSGAGFCLSATALRNGHRIIVVMMDSPDSRTRDLNVQELITQAFIRLPITEAPFARSAPGATEPERPSPTPQAPLPAQDSGPTIHMPGSGK
jgi:D-alanyl-D-alanine carboxypeptidase